MPDRRLTLQEAIVGFDRGRGRSFTEQGEAQRREIVSRFPLEAWPDLSLERFALGTAESENSFCRWLEFRSQQLGSMRGGSAYKHIIFYKREPLGWAFPKNYKDAVECWQSVRGAFVQAFELAKTGRWDEIDSLAPLSYGPALRVKTLHVYFPTEILPVYSRKHILYFLRRLGSQSADDPSYNVVRLNRVLLKALQQVPELAGWSTIEIEELLYFWDDPREAPRVLKIAPGEDARFWRDCLEGGYICIGWDALGDLSEFESKEAIRARLSEAYAEKYKGNSSTVSRKAREVWSFVKLEPGDFVVANHGTSRILAVGVVGDPAYEWMPSRTEFKNVVHVKWDSSYGQAIPPQKNWAFQTVAEVPASLYDLIVKRSEAVGPKLPARPVDPLFAELSEALQRKGQVILYGPPGTGKTYSARRFATWWLSREQDPGSARTLLGDTTKFAMLEASLSTAQVVRRVWWVVANPQEWRWDKLSAEKSVSYRYGRLQRNFPLVQVGDLVVGYQSTPDKRIVALAKVSRGFSSAGALALDVFLDELNRRIAKQVGREKQIGHSFLMQDGEPVSDPTEFASRFRQEILPLLQEYCYDDYATLAGYIGNKLVESETASLDFELLSDPASLISALEEEFLTPSGT